MSLTLIITINAALVAALLGGLACALARPALAAAARRPLRRAQGASDWSVRTSRATA